jgi:hypothetical protein
METDEAFGTDGKQHFAGRVDKSQAQVSIKHEHSVRQVIEDAL